MKYLHRRTHSQQSNNNTHIHNRVTGIALWLIVFLNNTVSRLNIDHYRPHTRGECGLLKGRIHMARHSSMQNFQALFAFTRPAATIISVFAVTSHCDIYNTSDKIFNIAHPYIEVVLKQSPSF